MRCVRGIWFGLFLVMSLTASRVAHAADDAHAKQEAAIRKASQAFVDAFNKGDAKAMGDQWTEDGDFVGPDGARVFFRKQFGGDRPQIDPKRLPSIGLTISSIRLLTDDVATVDGTSIFRAAAGAPGVHGRFTATWVNRDGRWLIDSVRESRISSGAHHEHLMELEPMLGNWVQAGANPQVRTTLGWAEDGQFMIRKFGANLPGRGERVGSQRIGWDPQGQHFRSWSFTDDGGYSIGVWSGSGGKWQIDSAGINGDGKTVTSTTRYTLIDNDTLQWESVDAAVDGVALPDLKVKLVRETQKN